MNIKDRYLGDGVYATYPDDYHVVLQLRTCNSTKQIALTPAMLAELRRFQRDIADSKNGAANE